MSMKSSEFCPELLSVQIVYHLADVGVDTDGLVCYLVGAIALAEVDADIGSVIILCRQLPERILDDTVVQVSSCI